MKKKKLIVGVLFALLLSAGAISVQATMTEEGVKKPTDSPDVVFRKCPPFCI